MELTNMTRNALISLLLAAATLAVYWQVGNHDFINYDDPLYVTENLRVQAGLTFDNVRWAFTTFEASNWHPLTWLSHMLDVELFGMHPRGHHLTSVVLHAINSMVLFLVLTRMTAAPGRSAIVAALFALHPLHVESVAWVAERKDVLSTLFFLLTIGAYVAYARRPASGRYLVVATVYALGLMAKPMLVTLPCLLLLLDYWPLRRFHFSPARAEGEATRTLPEPERWPTGRLIMEKLPLLLLTLAASLVTLHAQSTSQAMASADYVPLAFRLLNALSAYVGYISKMLWPVDLAVLYPLPVQRGIVNGLLCAGLLLGISLAVVRWRKQAPYLPVGWFWYLGTLVPVIGLVQVGVQAMADRYTYIPLTGLFIMAVWGGSELLGKRRYRRAVESAGAGTLLAVCALLTWHQLGHWQNSLTLMSHTIRVTERNWMAHTSLGLALADQGRYVEAIGHYREAIRISEVNFLAHNNLGLVLVQSGRPAEAITHYREAIRINPQWYGAYMNLGATLANLGRTEEAITPFQKAAELQPGSAEAHYSLASALGKNDRLEEAASHFTAALRLKPDFADAHYGLGVALARQGKLDDAAREFAETLRIKPDFAEAQRGLETIRRKKNGTAH
jgi:tetratricopeptide (TPR) repeat protein